MLACLTMHRQRQAAGGEAAGRRAVPPPPASQQQAPHISQPRPAQPASPAYTRARLVMAGSSLRYALEYTRAMCCACRGRPPLRWRVAALGQPRPCGSGGVGRDAVSGCAQAFHGFAAQERQRQQFAGGRGPCRRRRRHRGGPAPGLQRCVQGWPAWRASIRTPPALPATAPGLAGAPGPQWCRAAGSTGGLHRPGALKSLL